MNAESENENGAPVADETGESGGGLPAILAETVTAVATGIPPTAQRSLWKAFNRVVLAGVELPAKTLEGRARIAAARADAEVAKIQIQSSDQRARQKAREVVYRESAKAAAATFKDPELAVRALDFHASELAREQVIREDILHIAAEEIRKDPPSEDPKTEIDDDWLYSILREATKKSKDEYKTIFGRILAGEIKSPGTFSISAVETLSRIDGNVAILFQKACDIALHVTGFNARIVCNFADAANNGLIPYGLSYNELQILAERGLLRSEFKESIGYTNEVLIRGAFTHMASESMLLKRAPPSTDAPGLGDLQLIGPSFTNVGNELSHVVSAKPNSAYLEALAKWLDTQKVALFSSLKEVDGATFGIKVEWSRDS